jgi:exodeoxyribonuclease VII large subunit
MQMKERLSLSELNGQVKKVLSENFTAPLWVIGEISELNVNASGHCYMTLIEKSESEDRIIAQVRATVWSYTFRMLRPFFETSTGQSLKDGIKVLLQVSVEFHELYGYSLNVRNIDPTYTLGDQVRKRREIIQRLTDEGVITMNKELELPLVPQKIAVISSATAAGYLDFMEQLNNNPASYRFYTSLFPAVMQGDQAEKSILDALDRIYPYENFFDLVVIIRGGGSQVDLSCFDNYRVAYHVTQFPLPVLTGIGHEKDDSIVDLVAHTRLKTPTAVAEFILDGVSSFDERVLLLQQEIAERVENQLDEEKSRLEDLAKDGSSIVRGLLGDRRNELMQLTWKFQQEVRLTLQGTRHNLGNKIQRAGFLADRYLFVRKQNLRQAEQRLDSSWSRNIQSNNLRLDESLLKFRRLSQKLLASEKHRIEIAGHKGMLSDPAILLKKGYTITTSNGILVKSADGLSRNDIIQTRFYEGSVSSKIVEIDKMDKYDR